MEKRADVAPITVSRVVNNSGYVSAGTRQRVETAILELNYIPNTLAQSLRYQKTNTITLLVSDITNSFWTTVTRGVEDVCNRHDFNLILCNTDESQEKLEKYVNLQLERQTDGFLLVPTSDDSQMVMHIIQNHVPVVVLDRALPDVQVSTVRSDSDGGAYQLTKYLIGLGHRRIGMLSGPETIFTSEQRVSGYKRALQEAGIPVDGALIFYAGYTQKAGYEMANHVLSDIQPAPTALFAGNNFIAIGILWALKDLKLRVPEDISLVSFDDLPFDPTHEPFVTVAAQDPYQLGVSAAERLIQQIFEQNADAVVDELILPVEILIRKSCRPI